MTKLKKRILEDNVANITRSGKHYKPSFLEKVHPGRSIGQGSKPTEPKGKEEKEEEDRVWTQLNKNQAHVVDTAFCTPYDLGPCSPMMLNSKT